jgi:hypothetical protein
MSALGYGDLQLSIRIIDFLKREHSGRENAIPHRAIREHFCVPDDGQDNHAFRRLYENRVCSCAQGIFYATTAREVFVWGEYIERTYHSAALRKSKVRELLQARPDLRVRVPSVQPSLFDGARP